MTRLNPGLWQTNLNSWMKFNYRMRVRKDMWCQLWEMATLQERNIIRYLLAPPYRTLRRK